MRVMIISKACVVGAYQRKLEEIAKLGVDLAAVVPPSWRDPSGEIRLERTYTQGYQLLVEPVRFNGSFHWYFHPRLGARIAAFRPEILHIDEEPYNLATWHALWLARRAGIRALFFSWQNLNRRYPPPFSWGERWTLHHADYALMGTQSAADVWRAKGYTGPLRVIPQFGVDPTMYAPRSALPEPDPAHALSARPFVIGYIGRLVEEKGVDLILDALSGLRGSWCLRIAGQGPLRAALEAQAQRLGIDGRIEWLGQIPSTSLPDVYRSLSVLVIASRTRPSWKEQFGRVIVEANACGVPVLGSDSGAIPDLVGRGGRTFPEGDSAALRGHLQALLDDPQAGVALGAAGREQVLAQYTQAQIAAQTVAVYREMITG